MRALVGVTLLAVACSSREQKPPQPRPTATAIERRPRFEGELIQGTARPFELEAGQPIDLALDVRVPGPVRVALEGHGTLSPAEESGPGANALDVPLAAGRHVFRVRGRGPVTVTAVPGPGARSAPEPMLPGTIAGRLAAGGAHWLALKLPVGGAWTIDAAESATRVSLAVFRGRRQLAWSSPDDGARLTLDLDPGEALVRVSDSSGQGGPFVVRAQRAAGAAPDAPAVIDDSAPAQEWTTRLEAGRTRWLRLGVSRSAPFVLEVEVDGGPVDLELSREQVLLAASRGEPGARVSGWLDPGPHVVRISGREGATVRVRLAASATDPGRPLLHLHLRPVPAGPVALGRSSVGPGGTPDEDPLSDGTHEAPRLVTLRDGLLVSTHEVTQRAFTAVLGRDPSSRSGLDLPVHDVTFADALAFCAALTRRAEADPFWRRYTFRLPTEDEWEACCRAGALAPIAVETGASNRRPFAARLEEVAWFQSHGPDGAGPGPFPVGGRAPNAWGLFDVHGNVGEWCLPSPTLPPPAPGLAALRGGAWTTEYRGCRASNRDLVPASFSSASTGFRVVAEPR